MNQDTSQNGPETSHQHSEALSDGVVKIQKSLSSLLEMGQDALFVTRCQAIQQTREADKTIRENPYPAIGIAFGVGVLVTLALDRK